MQSTFFDIYINHMMPQEFKNLTMFLEFIYGKGVNKALQKIMAKVNNSSTTFSYSYLTEEEIKLLTQTVCLAQNVNIFYISLHNNRFWQDVKHQTDNSSIILSEEQQSRAVDQLLDIANILFGGQKRQSKHCEGKQTFELIAMLFEMNAKYKRQIAKLQSFIIRLQAELNFKTKTVQDLTSSHFACELLEQAQNELHSDGSKLTFISGIPLHPEQLIEDSRVAHELEVSQPSQVNQTHHNIKPEQPIQNIRNYKKKEQLDQSYENQLQHQQPQNHLQIQHSHDNPSRVLAQNLKRILQQDESIKCLPIILMTNSQLSCQIVVYYWLDGESQRVWQGGTQGQGLHAQAIRAVVVKSIVI